MHILRGDHGKIYTYHEEARGHWRARFQYKPLLSDEVKTLTATGSTKGKAESNLKRKWGELRASWNRGPAEAERLTVETLIDRWYPTVKHPQRYGKKPLSENTLEEYAEVIDRALVPRLGERTLAELTPYMLEEALWSMVDPDTGKGKANAQRSITILKKALAFARKNSWMEKNPLADVDTEGLYSKGKEPDALEVGEVDRVRQALNNWAVPSADRTGPTSEYVRDIFEFLAGTGCRISEALGLHWEDVHLEDEVPWVLIHKAAKEPRTKGKLWIGPTKTEDIRELDIPQFLVEVLRGRQKNHMDEVLVFATRTGNIIRRQSVGRALNRAMEREGLDESFRARVTHHAMRRTVATHLKGERAQRQLGHKSLAITEKHYIAKDKSRISHADLLEALGKPASHSDTEAIADQVQPDDVAERTDHDAADK